MPATVDGFHHAAVRHAAAESEFREADAASRALVREAACSAERVVSIVRVMFASTVAVRSIALWHTAGWETEGVRAMVALPAIGLAIAFSWASLSRLREVRRYERVLMASVAVDMVTVFAALLTNPLWPWEGYLGLVNLPDLGILLIITLGTGMRLSPRAAVLGSVLALLALGVLLAVDEHVSGSRVPVYGHQIVLYVVLMCSAGLLAIITSVRTRRLVERAARDAVAAQRAARNLDHLMRDHHDVRTLLSAVQLRAQLLDEALETTPAGAGGQAHELCTDLATVNALVDRIKVRSYGELQSMEARSQACLGEALDGAVGLLGARAPRIEIDDETRRLAVQVAGGAAALERVLFNLLSNAADAGATRVRVDARPAGAGVWQVALSDDGSGLPPHMLGTEASADEPPGASIGLGLAAGIVRASGGRLRLTQAPSSGGARVELELETAQGTVRQ